MVVQCTFVVVAEFRSRSKGKIFIVAASAANSVSRAAASHREHDHLQYTKVAVAYTISPTMAVARTLALRLMEVRNILSSLHPHLT
jgi:hypothetical protein